MYSNIFIDVHLNSCMHVFMFIYLSTAMQYFCTFVCSVLCRWALITSAAHWDLSFFPLSLVSSSYSIFEHNTCHKAGKIQFSFSISLTHIHCKILMKKSYCLKMVFFLSLKGRVNFKLISNVNLVNIKFYGHFFLKLKQSIYSIFAASVKKKIIQMHEALIHGSTLFLILEEEKILVKQ